MGVSHASFAGNPRQTNDTPMGADDPVLETHGRPVRQHPKLQTEGRPIHGRSMGRCYRSMGDRWANYTNPMETHGRPIEGPRAIDGPYDAINPWPVGHPWVGTVKPTGMPMSSVGDSYLMYMPCLLGLFEPYFSQSFLFFVKGPASICY